jgi:MraZ protein
MAMAIMARVQQLPTDDGGRVRLPDAMIAHAGLKDKVAFVGMGQKFKIWDADAYAAVEAESVARMKARFEAAKEDGL